MRFHIYDGRTKFWQWDLEQKLIVSDPECKEVHFCNKTDDCSLVCEVYEKDGQRLVNVPNILLQSARPITAFLFVKTEEGAYTQQSQIFFVLERTKPADYVYTETEVWTAEKAVADALKEAKESGDFKGEKGDKGDKGDAGVIEFIVVSKLPTSDIKNAIYLVPAADKENGNLFTEFVYVNGSWEEIGSAAVELNLDEFVKKTDYATTDKAGVAKIGAGLKMFGSVLQLHKASEGGIDLKNSDYNPIVPSNLDYAVRAALTDPKKVTWSDEEKAAARATLGAVKEQHPTFSDGSVRGYAYCINPSGEQVLLPTTIVATANTIALRNPNGNFYVSEPKSQYEVVNRGYLDKVISELVVRIEALEAMLKQ